MGKFPNHLRAFREAAGLSQPQLAASMDTSVQNVSRIERGERKLDHKWAEKFAPHLSTTAAELMFPSAEKLAALKNGKPRPAEGAPELTYHPLEEDAWQPGPDAEGEGYDRESYSPKLPGAIPELDAKAGAGEGAVGEVMVLPLGDGTISAHKIVDEWLLPAAYLREAVRNPNQAIVMSIEGDSMTPNYMPGDRVIIDLSQDRLEADGVYLISYDYRHPQVKRLQSVPLSMPPRVLIISDNVSYQPFEVEVDLLRIHGKVCAYVGRR